MIKKRNFWKKKFFFQNFLCLFVLCRVVSFFRHMFRFVSYWFDTTHLDSLLRTRHVEHWTHLSPSKNPDLATYLARNGPNLDPNPEKLNFEPFHTHVCLPRPNYKPSQTLRKSRWFLITFHSSQFSLMKKDFKSTFFVIVYLVIFLPNSKIPNLQTIK